MTRFSSKKNHTRLTKHINVFRTDSSNQIGSGHVMRCLTLARELANKGSKCHFICTELPGNMIDYLGSKGFPVHIIPCPGLAENDVASKNIDHLQLVINKKIADAGETIKIVESIVIENDKVDLLIVDHYSLDREWEQLLRPYTNKIMVIDDTADRPHDCDILLDQNLYENLEERYEGLLPEHCIKLLGPQYALLRPEFREARKTLRRRDGTVKRILVFMGGSDPTNETAKALEAISMLNRPKIVTDVVVGSSNPHRAEVEAMCKKMTNTNFYCQIENMAELMVKADLAIGGGGSTTWERCSVGLTGVFVSIAKNQELILKTISNQKAGLFIGNDSALSAFEYLNAISFFLCKKVLESYSINAFNLSNSKDKHELNELI